MKPGDAGVALIGKHYGVVADALPEAAAERLRRLLERSI